jgi:hypothetical protein
MISLGHGDGTDPWCGTADCASEPARRTDARKVLIRNCPPARRELSASQSYFPAQREGRMGVGKGNDPDIIRDNKRSGLSQL